MDMNLREWLIIIGVFIIVGVLLDGYRRMRRAKMDSLQMSHGMGGGFENTPIDEGFNPELPGGGVRVVGRSEAEIQSEMEGRREPTMATDASTGEVTSEHSVESEPMTEALVARRDESSVSEDETKKSFEQAKSEAESEPESVEIGDQLEKANENQEVIIINVHCKNAEGFAGAALRELLEACGLEHGEMNIFHRKELDDLLGPIQFSVANSVEPGYFVLEEMEQLKTPGISFFMSLPGPKDYMKAFDYMLETAQCVVRNLDGEMKDENRSVMTKQTIEHCRQRIKDFERKQLSRR